MKNNIKLVVFDMAGTTIDENNLAYKTIQKTMNEAGYPVTLDQVLYHGAGKEKFNAIRDILGHCTEAKDIERISADLFDQFKSSLTEAYNEFPARPIPGAEDLFQKLKSAGVKVCLNTGYTAQITSTLLRQVGWENSQSISAVVTADDVHRSRPFPDMIHRAMELLDVSDPAQVLKAGDSITDILEGKNANCGLTVGVLTGAQSKDQLLQAQPDYILDSIVEIGSMVLDLN